MGVDWFLDRSVLRFAEDQGCPDRKIAVGRTLPEQRTEEFDWIFPIGLGDHSPYYRNPHDGRCELDFDVRVYANQQTRPHEPDARAEGIRLGEGFYLDLVDDARPGPERLDGTPVYFERRDEGDSQVRLTYWMLYGMNAPAGEGPSATHEGDWERIDVLLRNDGSNRYEPLAVQLISDGGRHDVPWGQVARSGTHPTVAVALADHAPSALRPGEPCDGCSPWRTWETLSPATKHPWYGFGGAWGEPGPTSATTGPAGPHPIGWPTREQQEQKQAARAAALTR
jgi:hypothetical protein